MLTFALPLLALLSLPAFADIGDGSCPHHDGYHHDFFQPDFAHHDDSRHELACSADLKQLSCAEVQRAVETRGAQRMPDEFGICHRVVKDQTYCGQDQYPAVLWVETCDNLECFAGYACRDTPRD